MSMKTVSIASKGRYHGLECLKCGKKAKLGDVVIAFGIPDAAFHARDQVAHAECVWALLQGTNVAPPAPRPNKVQQFRELRNEILTTGRVFGD